MRRVLRLGRSLTVLLARLLLAQLAAAVEARGREADGPSLGGPARPGPTQAAVDAPTVAELMHRLVTDAGCKGEEATHLACAAAEALAADAALSLAVQDALEETVSRVGRPPCVSRAGIDALASLGAGAAARLGRMEATLGRRLEFDGTRGDAELLARLRTALRPRAAPGTTLARRPARRAPRA